MKELDEAGMERSLREKLASYGRQPSDKVWQNIEKQVAQHRKPAPNGKPWLLPLLFIGGLLLLLIGNSLPSVFRNNTNQPVAGAVTTKESAAHSTQNFGTEKQLPGSGQSNAPADGSIQNSGKLSEATPSVNSGQNSAPKPATAKKTAGTRQTTAFYLPDGNKNQVNEMAITQSQPSEAVNTNTEVAEITAVLPGALNKDPETKTDIPVSLITLVNLENQVAQKLTVSSPENDTSEELAQALKAEKAELTRLQQRADSLLKTLDAYVKETPVAETDSAQTKKIKSRWSAALSFAPERNFLSLDASADSLMEKRSQNETGSSGFNAALLVDYKLTDRLSISSGFGYSTYSAELRLTNVETLVETTYDTVTDINVTYQNSSQTVYSVHPDSVMQLTPELNGSGQVIDYDTSYIYFNDSVFFTIERGDTIRTIKQTINPNITQKEVTTYKVLKPTYHFVTLPVMLRYRLTPGARWWADVAFGAQLQLFRGGTQVVTEDGKNYRTEKIKASEGPFRQFNMALIGNLAVNYRLTDKLSVSLAPAVRYQVQSVYKKQTGLKQTPLATGLQFGIRYNF